MTSFCAQFRGGRRRNYSWKKLLPAIESQFILITVGRRYTSQDAIMMPLAEARRHVESAVADVALALAVSSAEKLQKNLPGPLSLDLSRPCGQQRIQLIASLHRTMLHFIHTCCRSIRCTCGKVSFGLFILRYLVSIRKCSAALQAIQPDYARFSTLLCLTQMFLIRERVSVQFRLLVSDASLNPSSALTYSD